jgi:DNA modification methylase
MKSPLEPGCVYRGDCRDLLPRLVPGSVALSFWSPPYHVGKDYEADQSFDEWKALLRDTIRLHFDAMKPGGFVVINIADILAFKDPSMPRIQAANVSRHRSKITREDVVAARSAHPDLSRYDLAKLLGVSEQTIDRRLNGNNIRGGKYNTQTRLFVVGGLLEEMAIEAGFYPYDRRIWVKDPAWMSSKWHTLSYRAVDEFEYLYVFWMPGETVIDRSRLTPTEWVEWGSRAVWRMPSVRANDIHTAMFPVALAERVIRLFSAPGDLVIDPFLGSGTTAVAAVALGREWIGMELDPDYALVAESKIGLAIDALGGPSLDAAA